MCDNVASGRMYDMTLNTNSQGIKLSPLKSIIFCTDDERVYAYIRFETGDEMSRRKKFAFLTWIGPSVSPLKKAKVSTDKAFVKKIVTVSFFKS